MRPNGHNWRSISGLKFHFDISLKFDNFFLLFVSIVRAREVVMRHVYVSFRDDDSSPDVWQTPKSAPETICSKRRRQFERRADELVQSVRFLKISALTLNLPVWKINISLFLQILIGQFCEMQDRIEFLGGKVVKLYLIQNQSWLLESWWFKQLTTKMIFIILTY